jgi:tetratricopeptide (TPR) repeat protein
MRKAAYTLILVVFFITGFVGSFFAQTSESSKTRVVIDRFKPLIESPENYLFEESFPYLIQFSFINQNSYTIVENGDDVLSNLTSGKKKEHYSAQYIYQANKTQISEIADVVLFGDFSITDQEIYIIPKLYDAKNDKVFTLQSIRITDFKQGLKLGKFEALVTAYLDKLRSVSKSASDLSKVAIRLASSQDAGVSSFEESLFKSFVVSATKTLDTTNLVAIVPLEKMKPFYLTNTSNTEVAQSTEADVVYSIGFEILKEDLVRVNLELFFSKSNTTVNFPTFTFDLYGNRIIENDLVNDFYWLFKELKKDNSFNIDLLNIYESTPFAYEEKGYAFYLELNYCLSNLMYYKALSMQTKEETKPYDYYMLGMNSEGMGQPERAIDFYLKSLNIDHDYKFSWWGLAYASYSMQNYAEAAEAWLKTYEIDPEYEKANLQYNVGLCYYGLENYAEAIDYFKNAIAEDYSFKQDAYYYIAICYEAILDYEAAINYFTKVIEQTPDDYNNQLFLAYFYYLGGETSLYDGQFKEAVGYFNKLHSIYTTDLDYDEYLGSLISDYYNLWRLAYLYLNDYENAWQLTEKGVINGQFDPISIYLENATELTFVLSENNDKRYNEIIRYYLLHTDINPGDTLIDQVYNSIGYYYSLLGEINTCAIYFEKALEINPDNVSAQLNIMELYLVLDNFNKLFEVAETIIQTSNIKSQLEANNGIHTMYYFLLLNAKVVTGKNIEDDKKNFEKFLKESDFSTGWDFSLYENWLNKLSIDSEKQILNEFYNQLKERVDQALLDQ